MIMNMGAIHISEAEAARDFAGLLARVRAGAEIIIENGTSPAVVLRPAVEEFRPRLISESIALAKKHAEELGYMCPGWTRSLPPILKRLSRTADPGIRRRGSNSRFYQAVVVYPLTLEIARMAGRIHGEQMAQGVSIDFQDLLIGVTALHLGYSIATVNVRHFRLIPQLNVIQL
jgi:antitoxin (DNA-binding transcriptional repressor) of toxin-antitoxin stability system